MSKKMLVFFSLLVLTACGSNQNNVVSVASVNYTPIFVNYTSSDVKNAAETGLLTAIAIVGDQWANLGFLSQDEVASAQVGTPYRIFSMTNPGRVNQTISDIDAWRFPVMVNNEYRCMLDVNKMNGEWQAVGIGAKGLATWLQAAEKSHPLLDFKAKGLVNIYDHDTTILMINPSEQQPSFLLLPYSTDLLKFLPQYSGWTNTDPVPVLSFQEIFLMFSKM